MTNRKWLNSLTDIDLIAFFKKDKCTRCIHNGKNGCSFLGSCFDNPCFWGQVAWLNKETTNIESTLSKKG